MAFVTTFRFALVACVATVPGIGLANPIEPGSYTAQVTTSNITAATLPDSVKKTMSEPSTRKQCISPAKAASWPLKAFVMNDKCTTVKGEDSGHAFSVVVTCAVHPPETITVTASGTYTPTHFDMQTKTESAGGAHPMTIERHTVGDRTGACPASDDDQD